MSTGHLGVRGRDPSPASSHYDIPQIPGHGWVALTLTSKSQSVADIINHFHQLVLVSSRLVHCGSIRQTATILSMNRDCLRTGDKASVHFRFIKTPEYLHCDQRLVFREGRTKAVGTITKVVQQLLVQTKPTKQRLESRRKQKAYRNLFFLLKYRLAFFAAVAVHQQFAIQFQTPSNQNAVDKEGPAPKRGWHHSSRWRRSHDSTDRRPQHDTTGEMMRQLKKKKKSSEWCEGVVSLGFLPSLPWTPPN